MKRGVIVALFALFGLASQVSAQEHTTNTYSADSKEVRWVGRVDVTPEGLVRFDWSGTYAEMIFCGSRLEMVASDSGMNYFNVIVNGQQHAIVKTEGKEPQSVVLFEGKGGTYHIRLQRRTEGFNGLTTIHAFTTDGVFVEGQNLAKGRHIEFIGDSLTAGYGTDSTSGSEPYTPETQNCNLAYGCYIARYFDADYNLVAHSGQGLVRNYGDQNTTSDYTMQQRYGLLFDEADKERPYNFRRQSYIPDLVVIFLGTNDFSTKPWPSFEQFSEGYAALVEQVRAAHGENVPILCVSSYVFEPTFDYVWRIAEGDKNLHFACILPEAFAYPRELGASEHPNRVGQQKMAMTLIPYISTITGWDVRHDM
ncbi:MAG: GDSL family lipase [Tidjanibacter sp.]|nr:GDSL family lipase [Tidjanibacter sp.]